jgi:GT2 family glycosyltransferase
MVDIIIVNWNSGNHLKNCVQSILSDTNDPYLNSIIIIDNNSNDASYSQLPICPKIKIIKNTTNLGFAKAANIGFKASSSAYVLLLNPDTIISNDTLNNCIDFLSKNQIIDVLGVKHLNMNGDVVHSCTKFPKPLNFVYNSIGLSKILPHVFESATSMPISAHLSSKMVDHIIGAFMFMRKEIFESVGYFDERFFVYKEDLDFSQRLSKKNGISYYNSEISIVHIGGGTTEKVKSFRLALSIKSNIQYAKKHFSIFGYILVLFTTFFIEPFVRLFYSLFSGRTKEFPDIVKGYAQLFKMLS